MLEAVAADPATTKVLSHPYSLSPDRVREPNVGRQTDQALERATAIDPILHYMGESRELPVAMRVIGGRPFE